VTDRDASQLDLAQRARPQLHRVRNTEAAEIGYSEAAMSPVGLPSSRRAPTVSS